MTEKRYYWFKMSSDFFERDDVKWVLSKRDGSDYIIIYLNLCLKSLCNGGLLFSKVGEMIIPYDSDSIFRELGGRYKESTILAAISCLTQAGLIHLCTESNCLAISNIESFIGSETEVARRVRKCREKKTLQCNNDVTKIEENTVTPMLQCNNDVTKCNAKNVTQTLQEPLHENLERKSNQKERYKENTNNKLKLIVVKESENSCNADCNANSDEIVCSFPSLKGDVDIFQSYVDEMSKTFPALDILCEIRKAKNWCIANPANKKTNISRFLFNWFSKAQDKAPRKKSSQSYQQQNNRIQPSMAYQATEEIDSL